ncbi:MAG: isoleucine--tRNA ligase [Alphaproteobacteria bacterium]|nr:isoleucine--tRNA ligase [Alphaproteobacteria bacterium]
MTTKFYPEIDANPNFAALEEGVLSVWRTDKTFEQSVARRPEKKADGSSNAYVFYDGPPFANGLPHYGHLLTGYVKDTIARYQTMKGKRVERRFGWDCHGLPAEMGAEKELGISGRAAIAGYGIDTFNEYCRTSVMKYTAEWEYYVTRQGRWVDFRNDYKTMDKNFMESCLWAFKQLHEKGLIYESMRVMPYSWAAETPVSNFETRIDNATREREDKAAYVKFRLKEKPKGATPAKNYYLVAWTTTPWTLPSNLALAINPQLTYGELFTPEGDCLFGSLTGLKKLFPQAEDVGGGWVNGRTYEEIVKDSKEKSQGYILVEYHKPKDLLNLTYEPLFPYFADTPNAFRVLDGSDFVTDGDGTGIVHMAPGFGEVDQACCAKNGIEVIVPVDEKGRFTAEIYDIAWDCFPPQGGSKGKVLSLAGLVVVPDTRIAEADIVVSEEDKAQHISAKDVVKYGLANMRILRWLKANGALLKDEPYKHNYPHCWRTDTPLIYRAMSSWYVNVQKIKATMAANNETIHWIPDHVREGQMGKGIESAPDWSISRNRFWGTPIPIWKSASGKMHVCGSIAEIEKLSGVSVPDLHRPYIDKVVLKIDGEDYHRIEDVFDCWFESGSMPYAQVHYPFENKEWFEENFPADFITEYIAQTRGWFYTLQVLSAALFGKAPFKNCICHGVVIDEETGLKYSKRLKNYRDPKEVMDAYGADALRWMMLSSPVMRGSDLGVDPDGKFIRDVVRLNIKPMWSAFNFFTLYANADGVKAKNLLSSRARPGISRSERDANHQEIPGQERARDDGLTNMLDRYILAKAKAAVLQVEASMDAYDTPGATEAITQFFDVLNNWYIRRSRPRFWGEGMTVDKQAAYDTLFTVLELMCLASAPLLPFTAEAIYRGLNGDATSVHLQDFPDVGGIDSAAELVTDMDWVQDICNAASAIRNKQNIRNRQPLASLTLAGNNVVRVVNVTPQVAGTFSSIICEEVNAKEFRTGGSFDDYASVRLQINSQVLGKRLPEKMKQILPASKKGEWSRKANGDVVVADEVLLAGEYTILLEPKPEYKNSAAPLSTNDALVILDLTITPELEAEGRARDLVRMIQQARKDSGLNVGDRITLALDVPADFQTAIAAHGDYIRAQTLAVSLGEGSASAQMQVKQELDGAQFVIGLSKVA